jgi:Zn-dependent peptidase ImmA (M78 family)/transcriptional regulator with XRE-family HTH domain
MAIRHQERELMPAILDRLLAAGKTHDDIASGTHISSQRLREIASGSEPTLYELKILAKFADVRLSDLMNDKLETDQVRVLLRRTPRHRDSASDPAEPFIRKVIKIVHFLPADYRSPEWNWASSEHRTRADAEFDAEAFRSAYFGGNPVDPILDLPRRAVEGAGILLFISSYRELDGLSCVVNRRRFVMLAPRYGARMLYTLAHEIGHHAAHLSLDEDFVTSDENPEDAALLHEDAAGERYANAFASALLLPRAGVGIALDRIRKQLKTQRKELGDLEILYLAHVFGTSFQVAARRCEDLRLMPKGSGWALYENLCKNYGNPEKRSKEAGLPPRPQVTFPPAPPVVVEAMLHAIRDGELSIGKASELLEIAVADLHKLNAMLT